MKFERLQPFYFEVETQHFDFPGKLRIYNETGVCMTYLSYRKSKPKEEHFDIKSRQKVIPLRNNDVYEEIKDMKIDPDEKKIVTDSEREAFEKSKAEIKKRMRLRRRADKKVSPKPFETERKLNNPQYIYFTILPFSNFVSNIAVYLRD